MSKHLIQLPLSFLTITLLISRNVCQSTSDPMRIFRFKDAPPIAFISTTKPSPEIEKEIILDEDNKSTDSWKTSTSNNQEEYTAESSNHPKRASEFHITGNNLVDLRNAARLITRRLRVSLFGAIGSRVARRDAVYTFVSKWVNPIVNLLETLL